MKDIKGIHRLLFIAAIVFLCGFGQRSKKKIIFFGDSITAAGTAPGGYIQLLDSMVRQTQPAKHYGLTGSGVGGNKVYDLFLRMDHDVLDKHPDIVYIWIGVNDVWHKQLLHTGTDANKFVLFYNAIIHKLKERKIVVYLCTPAVIGEKKDTANEQDAELNQYAELIRNVAMVNDCKLVDFRQLFANYLQSNNPENKDRGILTVDGVHLNAAGNLLVAKTIFKSL